MSRAATPPDRRVPQDGRGFPGRLEVTPVLKRRPDKGSRHRGVLQRPCHPDWFKPDGRPSSKTHAENAVPGSL